MKDVSNHEPMETNEGDMEVEKHDFAAPMSSRVKNFFRNPFSK